MTNINRYAFNTPLFKPKTELHFPNSKPISPSHRFYKSPELTKNSNPLKNQNTFQTSFYHQELPKSLIKNKYIYQGNEKRENVKPILYFENKRPSNYNTNKQTSKSPAKRIGKDVPPTTLELLTPINTNLNYKRNNSINLENIFQIPARQCQIVDKSSPLKYFKKRSINVPQSEENRLILSNKTPIGKQKTKYFPKQQIYNDRSYYIEDLVASSSNKTSPMYNHFHFIWKMYKNSIKQLIPSNQVKQIFLPQDPLFKNRKTILFDLDQTLIHCTKTALPPYDIILGVKQENKIPTEVGFNIRPYAKQILENLSKCFQIIVFTASHSFYANTILDYLDPQRKLIHHRLYRQHCQQAKKGCFVKDLRAIPRNIMNMVLVDNSSLSYCFQPQNGIPILSYYEGKNDFQLKKLETYLLRLKNINDVRVVNSKIFKTSQYANYKDSEQALTQLFVSTR